MTKIFEAVSRAKGEISTAVPLVLAEPDSMPAPQERIHVVPELLHLLPELVNNPAPGTPLVSRHAEEPPAVEARRSSIREIAVRLAGSVPLLPFDKGHSAASEQYRIIRTRLLQHPKQPRMVLISSATPGDGKSVTAVNIAGALSLKSEAKVLLADTDFRRSTIHTRLGLPLSPGLSDVLAGKATLDEAIIRVAQFPNLHVITAGESCANPSELLDSPRWIALCNELRGRFRYIIADSPPVASVADYDLLQATSDGVILVVRPDHTLRQICLKAIENLPKDKLIGVVMNCVSDWFLGRSSYYSPYYYGMDQGKSKVAAR